MVELHAEYEAECKHIPHERASSIGDQRKWDPGDRKELDRHSDILEYVEGDHADDTCAHIRIVRLFCIQGSLGQVIDQDEEETDHDACPDKAETLGDPAEDEVGVGFRDIDFTAIESLPVNLPRSDCVQGLDQVESFFPCVVIRIEP